MKETGDSKRVPTPGNDLIINAESTHTHIVINIQKLVITPGVDKPEFENLITNIFKDAPIQDIKFQYPENEE
jgi:hypothetical protein